MHEKQLRYRFDYMENCNMCGFPTTNSKILGKRLNQSQGKNPKSKIGITTTILKCPNCKLIYANPQPIPLDINDHYGILPENYWIQDYFTIRADYFRSEIDRLKMLIKFQEGMKSLDIGAGIGKAMKALSKAGFDAYGFEPSAQFYDRAITLMGIGPDKLKLGMIENMEYSDNYFDFISFGAVLEHLHDPSNSIIKALKWLKPNGIIHVEVPSSRWLINKVFNLYYKLIGTDYVGNISPMHSPYHLYEFGLKSFQKHSKQHNYDIAFYEYYVCYTYMPKLVNFVLTPFMRCTKTGMQLCVWLRKK